MMLRKRLTRFVWKKMIEKNDKKIDKKIDIGKQGEKVKEHLKVISTERRKIFL